jgi:hypothetical protein
MWAPFVRAWRAFRGPRPPRPWVPELGDRVRFKAGHYAGQTGRVGLVLCDPVTGRVLCTVQQEHERPLLVVCNSDTLEKVEDK